MLIWKSNFSVGVNIFFELNKFLAEKMKNLTPTLSSREGGYTPSITEIHHIHKLDKPSGTAKTLAEQIANPTPGEFYDRPQDARSSGALHPSREGGKPHPEGSMTVHWTLNRAKPFTPQGEEIKEGGHLYSFDQDIEAYENAVNNPTPVCSTGCHRQSDRAELFTRSREGRRKWIVYLNILLQGRHHTSY
jgi:hypothetical protein